MGTSQSKLEVALLAAESAHANDGALPPPLPMGHIGDASNLASILRSGQLVPKPCAVMKKPTLYLFYGSLAYRSSAKTSQEEALLPVAFLFHTRALRDSDAHYPFDTGAMAKGFYGKVVPALSKYKTDLRVTATGLQKAPLDCPRVLVKHLFATNRDYAAGRPSNIAIGKQSPIPDLCRFITADGSPADHRRGCVEIQRSSPLPLREDLLFLAYPETFEADVRKYLVAHPELSPETHGYPAYLRCRPSEVCSYLQGRAATVLEKAFHEA